MNRPCTSTKNRCRYCHKLCRTATEVVCHTAHARSCRKQWEKELKSLQINQRRPLRQRGPEGVPGDDNMGVDPVEVLGGFDVEMIPVGGDNSDIGMEPDSDPIYPGPSTPEPVIEVVPQEPARKGVSIEEVDEDEPVETVDNAYQHSRWSERSPGRVAEASGMAKTTFEEWRESQVSNGTSEWSPFANQEEWETAQWLLKHVGQTVIDEYLKMPLVSRS